MKKRFFISVGHCLSALASGFANAPCPGRLYDPEVPECLRM